MNSQRIFCSKIIVFNTSIKTFWKIKVISIQKFILKISVIQKYFLLFHNIFFQFILGDKVDDKETIPLDTFSTLDKQQEFVLIIS